MTTFSIPDRFIEDYAEGYDFRFDNGSSHTPDAAEIAMLIDFGHGLVSELQERLSALTHPAPTHNDGSGELRWTLKAALRGDAS